MPPQVADPRGLPDPKLDVHALVEPELGMGAADTRVFDAAPRALARAVAEHVVVEPHHPGLELACEPLALAAVACPHRRAEPELTVVGKRHRILFRVDHYDRQHRAE